MCCVRLCVDHAMRWVSTARSHPSTSLRLDVDAIALAGAHRLWPWRCLFARPASELHERMHIRLRTGHQALRVMRSRCNPNPEQTCQVVVDVHAPRDVRRGPSILDIYA